MPSAADITRLTQAIVSELHPAQVILFGSRAYGNPRSDSDVDLLVLMPTGASELATMSRIALIAHRECQGRFRVDALAKDPAAARTLYDQGHPLFRDAFDRGVVLYKAAA